MRGCRSGHSAGVTADHAIAQAKSNVVLEAVAERNHFLMM
jgi:hypothetical protein